MTISDPREPPQQNSLSQAVPVRRTLPPPEWQRGEGPRSAASLALERYELDAPVSRKVGPRAELGALYARLASASRVHDETEERASAAALARALAARGTELDAATRLARRALLLAEDPALREELAGWFASLGEPALAAATLSPLTEGRTGKDAAQLFVRIGVLLGRGGDAFGAREALNEAQRHDPSDPLPAELVGSLAAWAPETVSAQEAAQAYLVASERREALGERPAAFENLIRAYEMQPSDPELIERLAQALVQRGRVGAADDVRRQHARTLGDDGVRVHRARMLAAVRERDFPRALGAAFDARLDAEVDLKSALGVIDGGGAPDAPIGFDELLDRAGLHELLAARLELACEALAGHERARARLALARLYTGPLGRPERALDAWIEALEVDPGPGEALESLKQHAASTRDYSALIEALVRAGDNKSQGAVEGRLACLRELALLAEDRLGDAGLALWAVNRMTLLDREHEAELRATALRLTERARLQDEVLASARAALEGASGVERVEPLSRLAGILSGRPDQARAYLTVLLELMQALPEERSYQVAAERLLVREQRFDELEALLERLLKRSSSAIDRGRLRLSLATARRRRGDLEGALDELSPLLDEPGSHGAAWSMALLIAARLDRQPLRARALLRIAALLSPPLRAMLSSVAAELLLEAGDVAAAQAAAEQAAHADPSLARPAAARAKVGLATRDRWGAEAIERAMGVIVARSEMCAALADVYEDLDEPLLALAWTQRRIAIRPGDLDAARARLARIVRGGDGSRLADTLAWLLSLPQPLVELAPEIGAALRELVRLEPMRAGALARRALDVLGPRPTELRHAILSVADVTGERGLGITTVERWLAAGAPGSERAEVLLDLARRRRAANDADGAARTLLRALREGASATEVLAELDVALPTRSSDGELALLEARAEALSALPEADQAGTARAWREVGAAYFDLAGDTAGAMRAWERGMALNPERGVEAYSADLVAFAGHDAALKRLNELASTRSDPGQAAHLLAVASTVALSAGRLRDAFEIASRALSLDPSRADVLAVAERTASDDDLDALEALYERLADAALGSYGERAVHYRAARQFERRHEIGRALAHAIRAFEAVPSEGVAFVTMARLAERAESASDVVRALERVAQSCSAREQRAAWLRRAALFADASDEGRRQRLDVLLRALAVGADVELLRSVAAAASELLALSPEDREIVELRFGRAVDSLLTKLEGPEGARIAIEAVRAARDTFGAAALAERALLAAISCDGDMPEFRLLFDYADDLGAGAGAAGLVSRILEVAENKFSGAGPELLELGARIAAARGDAEGEARLLVSAARQNPENSELVSRAEAAARALGDKELLEAVLEAIPARERASALLALAESAEQSGDVEGALSALSRARALEGLAPETRSAIFERIAELHRRLGQHAELEELLVSELEREELDGEARATLGGQLAALVGARGDPERAIEILKTALEHRPNDPALLGDMVALARQAGDRPQQAEALASLAEATPDPAQRLGLLRELALMLEDMGDEQSAFERWAEVLRLDPNDVGAIAALERDAERRGDYESLVGLLARRASLASMVDDVRRIRLRRAAVLEQRLGRPDEARSELEALTTATGDNLSVLRVLADLNERLGAPLRAAPLWLRASAVAHDREEAADLSRRACEAYLAGGDVEAARRVLEGMETWARSQRLLELSVEVERRRQSPLGLAEALDELATQSTAEPKERALLLVEAARASLAGGARDAARDQAARAARMAPEAPEPQLLSRWLDYLENGPGDADSARRAVDELGAVSGELAPEQAELRAFLLAEALDVAVGGGAGLRELERAERELGDRPLIALGLAERLSAEGAGVRALPHFDRALAGDLRGLRSVARVALRAAETARSVGDDEHASRFVEIAAGDPETREAALALRRTLEEERRLRHDSLSPPRPDVAVSPESLAGRYSERPPPVEERLIPSPPPVPRSTSPAPRSASPAPRSYSPQPVSSSYPPVDTNESLAPRSPRSPAPSVVPGVRPSLSSRYSLSPPAGVERISSRPPKSPRTAPLGSPLYDAGSQRHASSTFNQGATPNEQQLFQALLDGNVEAGYELVKQLENRADRAHDLVNVCGRIALLRPGDPRAVARLYEAALADRDLVHARAVEHVLALLEPGHEPVAPPPLLDQVEQPDFVKPMLFRESSGAVHEVLGLVWEGAEHVFRRDPSTYGVTGLERVSFSARTPLARTYAAIARALGLTKTPLFQRRSAGPITVSLALLSPPAVVLSGEVRQETPELCFHLGAMLAGTVPRHALLFGSPESQARAVLKGLSFAFGPPRENTGHLGAVMNLAEVLWESIPARYQRRLRELCDQPEALEYDAAFQAARTSVRRAGLFAAGDLGVALREIGLEDGAAPGLLDTPEGLQQFCATSSAAQSLLGLALSPEYARTRWQFARNQTRY